MSVHKKGRRVPNASPKRVPKRAERPRRRITPFTLAYGAFLGLMAVGVGLVAIASGLPTERSLDLPERTARIVILDVRSRTIAERGMSHGGDVTLADLPPYVPLAFLAAEDRRFYDHSGLDPWGLLRAALVNLWSGRVVQGGSTISQQLAKNLFLAPERTFLRKLQEAMLAFWLESHLSKDEILALYLNRVYFGAGAYGIEAASRRYFAKTASELELGEAALLAGLLSAPSRYAPTADRAGALGRARLMLGLMVEAGFITQAQRDGAGLDRIHIRAGTPSPAAYFTDWVMELLPGYIGQHTDHLRVETTLNLDIQAYAENAVAKVMSAAPAGLKAGEAALVALAPDGSVKAMVGGRSYARSQFNRAVRARRQPGSAFKPFVYLAAIEAGFSPWDRISDTPVRVGDWAPGNYKDKYGGEVTLKEALAYSYNAAAVRVAGQVGLKRIVATARRLGLRGDLPEVPSLPLGTGVVTPLHLAAAYVPFANGGEAVMVNPIIRIETFEGKILYEREGRTGLGRAIGRAEHARIDAMLGAVTAYGTGRGARLETVRVAGKTGTSQNHRDAWFVGYTPRLTACVWVGNDDNTPMNRRVTGGTLPASIWHEFMTTVEREEGRTHVQSMEDLLRLKLKGNQ